MKSPIFSIKPHCLLLVWTETKHWTMWPLTTTSVDSLMEAAFGNTYDIFLLYRDLILVFKSTNLEE